MPSQIKTKVVWIEMGLIFYTRQTCLMFTFMLRCYVASTVIISTQAFWRALTESVDWELHRDKECPFSGVTSSGRVWRKVLENVHLAL